MAAFVPSKKSWDGTKRPARFAVGDRVQVTTVGLFGTVLRTVQLAINTVDLDVNGRTMTFSEDVLVLVVGN